MAVIQNALSVGANHPRKLYWANLGWIFSTPRPHRGIWPTVPSKSSARESLRFAS
jgi:hypothetical protein